MRWTVRLSRRVSGRHVLQTPGHETKWRPYPIAIRMDRRRFRRWITRHLAWHSAEKSTGFRPRRQPGDTPQTTGAPRRLDCWRAVDGDPGLTSRSRSSCCSSGASPDTPTGPREYLSPVAVWPGHHSTSERRCEWGHHNAERDIARMGGAVGPYAAPDILSALRGRLRRWLLREKDYQQRIVGEKTVVAVEAESSHLLVRLNKLLEQPEYQDLAEVVYARVFQSVPLAELAKERHVAPITLQRSLQQFTMKHLLWGALDMTGKDFYVG